MTYKDVAGLESDSESDISEAEDSSDTKPWDKKTVFQTAWELAANLTGYQEIKPVNVDVDEYEEGRDRVRALFDCHSGELANITGKDGDVTPALTANTDTPHLTFKDMAFSVMIQKEEKVILSPVSGHFGPGQVVALMGPSGCGKSTLLDMLAAKKTAPYEGEVLFNGHQRDEMFPRVTSYVPQEDIMPAHLTVKEVLKFSDNLKNSYPSDFKEEMQNEKIDMVLNDLGLHRIRKTRVGNAQIRGISGGQKRRVTLAKAYVSGASIVFADEPTSGLSSTDAEACVKTMRWIAKKFGRLFIVVIHQPRIEVANLFDHLLLLTANPGRAVYNGPMKDCSLYYEKMGYPVPNHSNPADHFLDMITPGAPKNEVDKFVMAYDKNLKPKVDVEVDKWMAIEGPDPSEILERTHESMSSYGAMPDVRYSPYALPGYSQLKYVFVRKLKLYTRDTSGIAVEYIMAVVKALLLGLGLMRVAREPAQLQLGFVYMMVQVVSLNGMSGIAKDIDDRVMMKWDTSEALYCELPYIISSFLIKTFFGFFSNGLFICIMFLFGGFGWDVFLPIFGWTVLSWLVFDSLFGMMAALAKSSATAQATAMPLVFMFTVYNGFTVTREGVPAFMSWAIYVSPAAYTIQGVAVALSSAENHTGNQTASWDLVNQTYGFTDQTTLALSVMIGWIILFRIIQAIGLAKLNKIQK